MSIKVKFIVDTMRAFGRYVFAGKFDNLSRVIQINKHIPITVIHSIEDELVSFSDILKFKEKNQHIDIHSTKGPHNLPIYSNENKEMIKSLLA